MRRAFIASMVRRVGVEPLEARPVQPAPRTEQPLIRDEAPSAPIDRAERSAPINTLPATDNNAAPNARAEIKGAGVGGAAAPPSTQNKSAGDITLENAKKSYADQIAKGARVVVTTSAGNGGQPVLVLIPPGFDPSKPARVHTHYHGNDATVADPRGAPAGTNGRMAAVQARDPQTVFVLPECANPSKQIPAWYSVSWENVVSQTQTTADALKAAGITNVGKEIVSAHSKGGSALARIIRNDPSGNGLRADRLELHDSLYGSQNELKDWAATANGKKTQSVLYYHAGNPVGRDKELEQVFKTQGYERIEMSKQSPMPKNPPYHRDSHYRTVGEFMDSKPGP